MRDEAVRPQPPTAIWRHWYLGRLRWAIPNLLIEETPERLVTLLTPGVVCKAPLAETYRRLVRVHASLATSDRDPVLLRDWAIVQLAEDRHFGACGSA
jgi:hypothetical protein